MPLEPSSINLSDENGKKLKDSSTACFQQVECCFDISAETFSPKVRKSFARNPKLLIYLGSFPIFNFPKIIPRDN